MGKYSDANFFWNFWENIQNKVGVNSRKISENFENYFGKFDRIFRNNVTLSNKSHHFHFPLVWASKPISSGFDSIAGNWIPLPPILYKCGESTPHTSRFISISKKKWPLGFIVDCGMVIRPILKSAVKIEKKPWKTL